MTDRSEMITAYLDGTMDEAALAAFEIEMARDEALAEQVARFAAGDDMLRAAFDAPMREPIDAALLERMGLGTVKVVDTGGPATVPLAANDNPSFLRRWQWPAGGAIAASLALFAVLQSGQEPKNANEFAAAMESAPSLASVKLANGGDVTPRLTFIAGDGRYCREYLRTGASISETGIACRREGVWQVEASTKGGGKLSDPAEIAAASGEGTTGLDAAYARLGASDPIGAEAERTLINRNWSVR